jgi:formylmethanofuran--tetrahydromethanopterin N-formyltransferase
VIINDIAIDDTFAEAFGMKATRLIITAHNLKWAQHSAAALTGFATSVIACGCEAGVERELSAEETPDARPGVAVLLFATSTKELIKQVERRVAMCVLTSPTSAVFAGVETEEKLPLGKYVRYFGDGYQTSKLIGGKRYWRIPVMDGDFLAEDTTGMVSAIGGGNFLVLARSQVQALTACEAAMEACANSPMSSCHSRWRGALGSKVGSKYPQLRASTNDPFCPPSRAQPGLSCRARSSRCWNRHRWPLRTGHSRGDASRHRWGVQAGTGERRGAHFRRRLRRQVGEIPLSPARDHGLNLETTIHKTRRRHS